MKEVQNYMVACKHALQHYYMARYYRQGVQNLTPSQGVQVGYLCTMILEDLRDARFQNANKATIPKKSA